VNNKTGTLPFPFPSLLCLTEWESDHGETDQQRRLVTGLLLQTRKDFQELDELLIASSFGRGPRKPAIGTPLDGTGLVR